MNIITVSGSAQHGKDTFANFAKEELERYYHKKVMIIHYADSLKDYAKRYYGWDGQKDDRGRSLLQYLGTDLFRKNNPNCWVNIVKELILGGGSEFDYIIIPDTRFPNEIDVMKEIAGKHCISVKVIRSNFDNGLTEEQKNHPSETALNNYNFDFVLSNNGTLENYKNSVIDFCNILLGD